MYLCTCSEEQASNKIINRLKIKIMVVRVVKMTEDWTKRKVLNTFDNFEDALNFASEYANGRLPIRLDRIEFYWQIDSDTHIITEVDDFFAFRPHSIVQSDNNNSPYRFTDAEVLECINSGLYPNYLIQLPDGKLRIVREKDIRIQRWL